MATQKLKDIAKSHMEDAYNLEAKGEHSNAAEAYRRAARYYARAKMYGEAKKANRWAAGEYLASSHEGIEYLRDGQAEIALRLSLRVGDQRLIRDSALQLVETTREEDRPDVVRWLLRLGLVNEGREAAVIRVQKAFTLIQDSLNHYGGQYTSMGFRLHQISPLARLTADKDLMRKLSSLKEMLEQRNRAERALRTVEGRISDLVNDKIQNSVLLLRQQYPR